jgi:DNA-binding GntR family transcriptional regulator
MVENRVLADHVYEAIKQMIADGQFDPGVRIRKKELEDALDVSQTPINDALSRLYGEGYLELEPRKGYAVRHFRCRELVDLFAARAAIEGMAARLAAAEADADVTGRLRSFFSRYGHPVPEADTHEYALEDTRFHEAIIHISGNPILTEQYDRFGYILKSNLRGLVRPPSATLGGHRALIEAIISGDQHSAQSLMTEHIMRSRDVLSERCREHPEE